MLDQWIQDKTGLKTLSQDALRHYQWERIRQALDYVKEHSRSYPRKLKEVGEISSLEEYSYLPFTYPDELKDDPFAFLCVHPGQVERIVTLNTSGTTGNPKRIFFTREDMLSTVDFFAHGMSIFTRPKDVVLICMPGNTPGSVGDLLRQGLARMGAKPIIYGVADNPEQAAQYMADYQVNVAVGLPMQMYQISKSTGAKRLGDLGCLRGVLLSADFITSQMAEQIEESLNCPVYEHYGMTETCFGGGVFCQKKFGYHLREADLYFEIVHPVTGRPVKTGQYGEVAVTTFGHRAMPLLRYRTGDIARYQKDPCPCGSILPVMSRVVCRKCDVLSWGEDLWLALPDVEAQLMSLCSVRDVRIQMRKHTMEIGLCGLEEELKEVKERFETTQVSKALEKLSIRPVIKEAPMQKADTRGMTKRRIGWNG